MWCPIIKQGEISIFLLKKENLGGNKQWWIIMHVNVLVGGRDSHAYPSVTREKIIEIAKRHAQWDQLCYLPTGRAGDTTMVRVRNMHNAQRTKAEEGAEQGGQKKRMKIRNEWRRKFVFSSHDVWGGGVEVGGATRSSDKVAAQRRQMHGALGPSSFR